MTRREPFARMTISASALAPSVTVREVALRKPASIATLVRRYKVGTHGLPFVCSIDGLYYGRAEWPTRRVEAGEHVIFRSVLQGGGGSNPLNLVMQAVLAVATGGGSIWAQIGTFAMSVVKGMVVNSLLNLLLPSPKQPAAATSRAMASPSPTYTLQAQGNSARLGQPIPVLYGRHLIFPDYAADPYGEFRDNEQDLFQLFCVSQGQVAIEQLRIEDTVITGTLGADGYYRSDSPFTGVVWQIVPPGGTVTLFPANVSTSGEVAGQKAEKDETLGPFAVNEPGTVIDRIGYDVVCPKGLYWFRDDGTMDPRTATFTVDAQQIDDSGNPLAAWFQLATHSVSKATNTAQRFSWTKQVPLGRYRVRLTRVNDPETSTRGTSDLHWAGVRGYHPGNQAYGDVTMLALQLRAGNQISEQSARRINLIGQRYLRTWHPETGWTPAPVATRNPAWALADMARAQYGGRLPDSRIELSTLYELAALWESRGDRYDAVHDTKGTLWEALTLAARVGRAAPYTQYAKLFFVRDTPSTMPAMLFSDRNIVRGSMRVRYIVHSSETVDAVECDYMDENTWSENRVLAKLADSAAEQPARLKLFGAVQRLHVWRECMHMAGANRYRRAVITLSTGKEGLIPRPGTLCAIQHRRPKWGQSGGDLVAFTGANDDGGVDIGGVLTLERPVEFLDATPHFVAFRGRRGEMHGPYQVTAGADAQHVVLAEAIDDWQPYVGANGERTHVVFGPSNRMWIKARLITPIRPRTETVELAFVIEADEMADIDAGSPPAETPVFNLPTIPDTPSIGGDILAVPGGAPDLPTLALSWPGAVGTKFYLVEHSYDNESWVPVGQPTAPSYTMQVQRGMSYVRVAPVGRNQGPWVYASVDVQGGTDTAEPGQPDDPTAAAFQTTIVVEWPEHLRPDIRYIEIWRSPSATFAAGAQLDIVDGNVRRYADPVGTSNAQRWYWYRLINTRGEPGPWSLPANATTTAVGGVTVVANVPTSNMGDIVFVSTQQSLYEWQGTAYVKAQPTIAANKILAGTITAALRMEAAEIVGGTLDIAGKFSVDANGNVLIRSSASGARVEVRNNVIKVFDDNNVVRVKIGDLSQ